MMKKDWEMNKLGDLVKIQSGFAFDSKLFTDNAGMPLIRIRDIKRGYSETFYNGDYNKSFIIRNGDVLIGMDGEFNIAKWKSDEALLNQRVCKIESANEKKLDIRYLLYFLPLQLKQIEDKASFVTVKHLSVKDIQNIQIPLPPLPIQKNIVDILDKADALRRADKELLQKYDQLAQAIFIDMFGDVRSNEKAFLLERIEDACNLVTDGSHRTPKLLTQGFPFLTVANMKETEFDLTECKRISEIDYDDLVKNKCQPLVNDILFSKDGTVGKVLRVRNFAEIVLLSSIAILRFKADYNPSFIEYYLRTPHFLDQATSKKSGSAIRRIVLSDLKDTIVPKPPLELQNKFERRILNLEKQKTTTLGNIKETEKLFGSLLQKAFKGELI